MNDTILSIVSSLTFSGALTVALVFLARNWISHRLKVAMDHEYAEKLETFKARLKAEHDIALEKIKASNAQNQAVKAAATASLTTTHAAAQEKRLHALETFWKATVQIRAKSPPVLTFLDILLPEEYDHLLTNPKMAPAVERLTVENLADNFGLASVDVDEARLYAGEYLFALFWAYRASIGRIAFEVMQGRKKGTIEDWATDSGIRQLMGDVLSTQEVEEFDELKIGRINWLRNAIEGKMLSHSAKIISGEASAAFGLEQARKIAASASQLEEGQMAQQQNQKRKS